MSTHDAEKDWRTRLVTGDVAMVGAASYGFYQETVWHTNGDRLTIGGGHVYSRLTGMPLGSLADENVGLLDPDGEALRGLRQ